MRKKKSNSTFDKLQHALHREHTYMSRHGNSDQKDYKTYKTSSQLLFFSPCFVLLSQYFAEEGCCCQKQNR